MLRRNYTKYLFFTVVLWVIVVIVFTLNFQVSHDPEDDRMTKNRGLFFSRVKHMKADSHIDERNRPVEEANKIEKQLIDLKQIPQIQPPEIIHAQHSNYKGEFGVPVNINEKDLSPDEKIKFDRGWMNNAFNEYASNLISLHRKLPDMRDKQCLNRDPKKRLPIASVIIIFHNEAWSTLLRTVHSVLDRSPSHLLKEIILVDDNSTMPHLKAPLAAYVNATDKVYLIRAKTREGLIRSRLIGSDFASGDVLIFLDSHCEATEGWLEALLDPIADDSRVAVVPVIESIDDNTFEIRSTEVDRVQIGGFDWGLIFRWFDPSPSRLQRNRNRIDPLPTPTMAGGLFAIDRKWFNALGRYDPGMEIWGGENLELSFKVWMCGGKVLTAVCSHVGHVFRKRSPYSWGNKTHVLTKNLIRLAYIWLDDYKKFYFERVSASLLNQTIDANLTSRFQIREKLQCKNFSWYHKEVYPEMFVPTESLFSGEIRNEASNYCIDSKEGKGGVPVIGYICHGMKGNQLWYLSKFNEIRRDLICLDYKVGLKGLKQPGQILTSRCNGRNASQFWSYNNGLIRHRSNFCIELSPSNTELFMNFCNSSNKRQLWKWHPGRQ